MLSRLPIIRKPFMRIPFTKGVQSPRLLCTSKPKWDDAKELYMISATPMMTIGAWISTLSTFLHARYDSNTFETLIRGVTIGVIVGATYPVSFPLITIYSILKDKYDVKIGLH